MVKKAVIVGAEPSDLLLAHYLLNRDLVKRACFADHQHQIKIYERRNDFRTVSASQSRTFPLALNDRGMLNFLLRSLAEIPKWVF